MHMTLLETPPQSIAAHLMHFFHAEDSMPALAAAGKHLGSLQGQPSAPTPFPSAAQSRTAKGFMIWRLSGMLMCLFRPRPACLTSGAVSGRL
jgi:hypothetical protein